MMPPKKPHAVAWCLGLILIVFPFAAMAATRTWDGGGSGNNCSTVGNWTSDTKPTAVDDVVLDGTSTKDLTWDSGCPTGIKTWSQNSGYTGTASFSITNFTLTGGLTLAAGTFTAPSGSLTIRGTVAKTGGTFSHNNGTVVLAGTGTYTLDPGGTSFNNLTLDNGLVGYWKLDEGTGNKARDSSRFGNHGTLTNMSTGIGGPSGWSGSTTNKIKFYNPYGLQFDGTNDYVGNTSLIGMPTLNGDLSISLWLRYPSATSRKIAFALPLGDDAAAGHSVDIELLGLGQIGAVRWGAVALVAAAAPSINVWHHIVYTQLGSTNSLYIDGGTPTTSTTSRNSGVPTVMRIGSFSTGWPTPYWTGLIDDVRVYKRALSASEVNALYNGNKSTGSGTYTLGSTLTVAGALSVYAGTLDVSGSNFGVNVAGNVAIHADLTPHGGTVTLNGSGNQTVSGSTVFWNLTKSVSTAANLFLDYTARQSASGALILQGAAENLLSLRSTRNGSGTRLLLDGDSGTQTLTYLDVKDSDASGGALLSCLNCVDSGNTTNWQFIVSQINEYFMAPESFNSGGGEVARSNNYLLSDSLGEPIVGFGQSQNYQLESGYRHSDIAQVMSIACSTSVDIGSVVGTGQQTGIGSCTVETNNASGYNLSWTVLSGSGGTNTGYLISQHNDTIGPFTPAIFDTPDSWAVAAANSEWGGRLSSVSTDTAAEWGVDGVSEKWLSVAALTSRTIASRSTPTPDGGSNESIQFRSEVGASAFKQTGTYQTTVTLTAVTL